MGRPTDSVEQKAKPRKFRLMLHSVYSKLLDTVVQTAVFCTHAMHVMQKGRRLKM